MFSENLKKLRAQLNLSQTAFGAQMSVTRNVINNLELGRVDPSVMMVANICNTFVVNEAWLRHGTGYMFTSSIDDELAEIAMRYDLDDVDIALIRTYITLPKAAQSALKNFLSRLAASQPPAQQAHEFTQKEIDAIADRLDALEESSPADQAPKK